MADWTTIYDGLVPAYFRDNDDASNGDLRSFYVGLSNFLAQLDSETLQVITDSRSLSSGNDLNLKLLAWEQGIELPDEKVHRLSLFLSQVSRFQSWKGNYDLLKSAIFVATGLVVTITVPYRLDYFIVGEGEVGVDEVGMDTRAEAEDVFIVGSSPVGSHDVGSEAINSKLPYTFHIEFLYNPGDALMKVVRWVVKMFKRAIDTVLYIVPEVIRFWQINVSRVGVDSIAGPGCFEVGVTPVSGGWICGPDSPVTRIQLPSGAYIEDT